MLIPALLLLAATSADPFNFTQLGVSAIVCSLLLASTLILWRQLLASQARERTLLEEATARERDLAEKTLPLLIETTRLLASTPDRIDQVLDKMRDRNK